MVESQPASVELDLESEEELGETGKFDVHAWFEAYLEEPEPAEHPGVPYN